MCMRCGKRTSARNGEPRCTCRQEREACERAGRHGAEVEERRDAIFADYIHRICKACGQAVRAGGGR